MLAASVTTVQLKRTTLQELAKFRKPFQDKTWDDPILRALRPEGEFFFDVIAVDGEYGRSSEHEIIMQIGDDPPHYWLYKEGKMTELEKLPKMKLEVQTELQSGSSEKGQDAGRHAGAEPFGQLPDIKR